MTTDPTNAARQARHRKMRALGYERVAGWLPPKLAAKVRQWIEEAADAAGPPLPVGGGTVGRITEEEHGMTYREAQRAAAARAAEIVALPAPDSCDDLGRFEEGSDLPTHFDPWELLPSVYGSYSSEFDDCALRVLRNLRDKTGPTGEGLPEEMLREMLCVLELCEYGTSPRVCFPTPDFRPLLPALIEKWEDYVAVQWGRDMGASAQDEHQTADR